MYTRFRPAAAIRPEAVGLYPTPSGIEAFEKELAPYVQGKGSVQFPLDRPIPYDLVARITAFRVKETRAKKSTF